MQTQTPASHQPPFGRLLVANRGEIAVRVVRAARELGVAAVAVYGPGEEDAPHVRLADEAYRLPSGAPLPYLDIDAVLAVADRAGAHAVHPGYGFLAENAGFAAACASAGLVFVGPPPEAIRAMGDKIEARRLAAAAGVPVVPGTDGPVASVEEARAWVAAQASPFPLAIKAAAGGGGRGFRVAQREADLEEAFAGAAGEAARSFADPTVYLERYLEHPRHIEVQIFADKHGNTVAVGERDCSVQRRHQKLIEETPAPGLPDDRRQGLWQAALALARAVGYRGAGTVEFMLTPDGAFFFLEMNTRIQVEHPITEQVTGFDLVKEQIAVAAGRPLSFAQADVRPRGHAIECRINAEDPGRGFAPAPGVVTRYREPGGFGVRVDTASETGTTILPSYDSLIAKLIAWGRDRPEAIACMERALADFVVEGVPTTIPFHRAVLAHPAFRAGEVTTGFVAEHPEVVPPPAADPAPPPSHPSPPLRELVAEVDGRRFAVRLHGDLGLLAAPAPAGPPPRRPPPRLGAAGRAAPGRSSPPALDGHDLVSPIQGTVVRIVAEVGQAVARGDVVAVVEAMKMENEVAAHRDGTLETLRVAPGDAVKIGDVVAVIA